MTLSLESFRTNFSMMPWHFWQLSSTAHFPLSSDCNDLVYQYSWQGLDSTGRDDVSRAIASAEKNLKDQLGYSPTPHYNTATLKFPQIPDPTLMRINYAASDSRWMTVKLPEGKIIKVGVEARTLIGTVTTAGMSPTLVYSDTDGDGVNDLFTATIATTVTDVTQIELQFSAADRWDGSAAGDKWVIDPINVSITGGVATITGKAWQAVKPVKFNPGTPLDPTTSTNFAATLDVYRHYCDPTGTTQSTAQAVLIWETRPFPFWATCFNCTGNISGSSDTDPAAQAYALARVGLRDAERGIVSLGEAVYNSTTGVWGSVVMSNCRPPDRVEIRYHAGVALDDQGHIPQTWQTTIARLAAAELGKRVCACVAANRMIYEQQVDRAFGGDARVEKFTMTPNDNESPFGYKEGQLYAWRQVQALRQLIGVRV